MADRLQSVPYLAASVLLSVFSLISCGDSRIVLTLAREDLFSLEYGRFEDQLDLFSLASAGGRIETSLVMKDGLFYVVNGESQKILQFNSYGDMLSIYYNEEANPAPSFSAAAGENISTQKAVSYPFSSMGGMAVDEKQWLYVADTLPAERQVLDEENGILLDQVVLRFDSSGAFVDYLGQQGPSGTPFPYIRGLYTTADNELAVVCASGDGSVIYWFSDSGYRLYTIPVTAESLPNPLLGQAEGEVFAALDSVIPDRSGRKLYFKIDYYVSSIDAASKVQAGIDYNQSLLYPFNIETGQYETPIPVPPLEKRVEGSFSDETYRQSYEFLGVTLSGWYFFIATDGDGYMLQMIQQDGRKILRRHLSLGENSGALYYSFSLSGEGIVSALFANEKDAAVSWWRADQLIEALVKQ